jgi:hypothetical protein
MIDESIRYFKNLEELYKDFFREKLKKDTFIKEKLLLLLEAIEKTRDVFIKTGSFDFCARCAGSGEKCCQAGLEWKLSKGEFFINLLLFEEKGTSLKLNLERPEDCLFLGENGCSLILTPLFCRNFFCEKLSSFLGYEKLIKIQQTMEDEAKLSFELSDYINKKYLIPYSNMTS